MSTWYHHDYPQSNPNDFSTLEVAPQPTKPDESFKEMQSPTGLEPVHLKWGNLPARYNHFDAPEAVAQPSPSLSPPIPDSALSPYLPASLGGSFGTLTTEKALESNEPKPRRICGLRATNFWSILVLIVLTIAIVVGLSVGLTVGGDQSHHKKGKDGNSDNSALVPPAAKGVSNNSSLASIAFNDTSGLLHYRIYFQDDTNMIKESSWNASTKLWQLSNTAIGKAKSKSPLAAIVTGPPTYAFRINIYAISESGSLIAWISVDTDFASTNTSFTPGPISNQGIVPATSSNLAAVWDRGCDQCSTALNVVYEGVNGQIQYGNLTKWGWQWTALAVAPIGGTGLALDVRYLTNGARDIMLYYQLPSANLVPALYNGTSGQWQYREDKPLSPIAKNAPIAAFSHGWNADGSSNLEEVLSSGNNGATYDLYNGQIGGWGTQQKAQVMAFVQNYSSLAANADAHAYAMQGGVISEFEMTSGGGWASVGNVTTS